MLLYCTDLIFRTKILSTAKAVGTTVTSALSVSSLREKLEGSVSESASPATETQGSARDERSAGGGTGRAAHDDSRVATLLIVDLDAEDALEAIALAAGASPRPRIVAFVSHVRAELASEARRAGADEVMARSAFVTRLPALVAPSAPDQRQA